MFWALKNTFLAIFKKLYLPFIFLCNTLCFHQICVFLTKDTKIPVMAVFLRLLDCLPSFILSTKLYSKEKKFFDHSGRRYSGAATAPRRTMGCPRELCSVYPMLVYVTDFESNGFNPSTWVL